MKAVKQALIFAGGKGTRLGKKNNPNSCKSLIFFKGEYLINRVIDSLKKGGIKDFLIVTNPHCNSQIKKIIKKNNISYKILNPKYGKYQEVPFTYRRFLDDRFLMAFGHQYVTVSHIKKMIDKSKEYELVVSTYDCGKYPIKKPGIITYKNKKFDFTEDEDMVNRNKLFSVQIPCITKKSLTQLAHEDNSNHTYCYYLYLAWKNQTTMCAIKANMPPEFDYVHQFKVVKEYLSKTLKTR